MPTSRYCGFTGAVSDDWKDLGNWVEAGTETPLSSLPGSQPAVYDDYIELASDMGFGPAAQPVARITAGTYTVKGINGYEDYAMFGGGWIACNGRLTVSGHAYLTEWGLESAVINGNCDVYTQWTRAFLSNLTIGGDFSVVGGDGMEELTDLTVAGNTFVANISRLTGTFGTDASDTFTAEWCYVDLSCTVKGPAVCTMMEPGTLANTIFESDLTLSEFGIGAGYPSPIGRVDGTLTVTDTSLIDGGTFNGPVIYQVGGELYGGLFQSTLDSPDLVVWGGMFNGEVRLTGGLSVITGGTFNAPVLVDGWLVNSGTFNGILHVRGTGSVIEMVAGGTGQIWAWRDCQIFSGAYGLLPTYYMSREVEIVDEWGAPLPGAGLIPRGSAQKIGP
jgi:hypothetical protein